MKVFLAFLVLPILMVKSQSYYHLKLNAQQTDKCLKLATLGINITSPLKISSFKNDLFRRYYGIMNLIASDLDLMTEILKFTYEPFTERLRQNLCDLYLNDTEELDEEFFHLLPDHVGMNFHTILSAFMRYLNFGSSFQWLKSVNTATPLEKIGEENLIFWWKHDPPKYLIIYVKNSIDFSWQFERIRLKDKVFELVGFAAAHGEVVSNNRLYRRDKSFSIDFRSYLDVQLINLMLNKSPIDENFPENIFLYKLIPKENKDENFKILESLKKGSEEIMEDISNVFNKFFN